MDVGKYNKLITPFHVFSYSMPCVYLSYLSLRNPALASEFYLLSFFCFFFLRRMGKRTKLSLSSPHFHVFSYASCVDLTQLLSQPSASTLHPTRELSLPAINVPAAAQAAVVRECVSMSTAPDSWISGAGTRCGGGSHREHRHSV